MSEEGDQQDYVYEEEREADNVGDCIGEDREALRNKDSFQATCLSCGKVKPLTNREPYICQDCIISEGSEKA